MPEASFAEHSATPGEVAEELALEVNSLRNRRAELEAQLGSDDDNTRANAKRLLSLLQREDDTVPSNIQCRDRRVFKRGGECMPGAKHA